MFGYIRLSVFIVGSVFLLEGCQQKKKKAPAKKTTPAAPVYPGGGQSTVTEQLEITASGETGSFSELAVRQLRQVANWTFSARVSGGSGTARITSIEANPKPSSMNIPNNLPSSTATVSFTPQNQAEMTGSITVRAEGTNSKGEPLTQSKTFTWRQVDGQIPGQQDKNGMSGFLGIIVKALPTLFNGGGFGQLMSEILPSLGDMMINNNNQNP
jgi:hypothetical protein